MSHLGLDRAKTDPIGAAFVRSMVVGAASGMSLNIIGGLLGHSQAQTTLRYAHLSNDPLKAAANQIAGAIAATMRGHEALDRK